ncbi:hypothetical protein IGI04_023621 [Brassica rapa subsp. trilocularis]|uniref:DUF4283 domain-containing protein n=1 Tax=Brassica rapa subsp. trilocularis TaxID=1813537 RepID=A0ABQ7M6J8_BRACM|nr:hypothetical protein IGI04_023621 [Brassica rapa subsp. trilocularis]
MLFSKKKHRPPFSRSSKAFRLILSARMANKKSCSLVASSETGAAALASSFSGTISSFPVGSLLAASGVSSPVNSALAASGSAIPAQSPIHDQLGLPTPGAPRGSGSLSVDNSPSITRFMSPLATEVQSSSGIEGVALPAPSPAGTEAPTVKNYAALLKNSTQLQEMGTPVDHISGAPFVLIPDENIETAKKEFKDFIYARFHGDFPSMGKIIGVVNAVWAKTGPRIFVHNIGHGTFLLRVTTPRTREVLLSRTCWNIGGLPMFVAPWSPDYSPDEPPLTSAIVRVELKNVPYLLFNKESLSRLATAIAKLYVRVDLTTPLPRKIVSGFTNGKEVVIDVTYPWLPVKCDLCKKFGHPSVRCDAVPPEGSPGKLGIRKVSVETSRRRSRSRPGRSTDKKVKQGLLRYQPVLRPSVEASKEATSSQLHEEDVLIASTIQEDHSADLEEGEIPHQITENTTDLGDANANKGSITEELSIEDQYVTTVEKVEFSPRDDEYHGLSTGAFDVLARISPEACDEDLLSASVDETKSEDVKTSTAKDADDITVSEENSVHKSLLDSRPATEGFIHPAEEQDRDNPFFLVKNRNSGRKATKRH